MIKCIAVDDEPLALEQLTGYIARVPFLQLIASCQDAFSAMQLPKPATANGTIAASLPPQIAAVV